MGEMCTPLEPWIARKIGTPALDADALRRYQLHKLQETLEWVRARSPFYRARLADVPGTLAALSDLSWLPFTTAGDIRANPLQFLCTSQSAIHRVVTLDSSGTTGSPKRLYFTREDQALTIDFFHIGMSTFTDPGDRVLILLPCERPGSVGDLLATGLDRLGAVGIKHGLVRDVAQTLQVMVEQQVTGLVGVPAQLLALVRHPQGRALAGDLAPAIKSVLLSTDTVPDTIAGAVSHAWDCAVYNHYGMTEMGLGGGVECRARRGYHLREADLYVEIVDPATGASLPDGTPGEIVFTTLTRVGMPLIRYRTGDLSFFMPGPCPCGTQLRTLAPVRGRLSNLRPLGAGGALSMAVLDAALFPIPDLLDFSVSLACEEDRECLAVTLLVTLDADLDVVRLRAQRALESLPVIRVPVEMDGLKVVVRVQPESGEALPYVGKRTIRDRRPWLGC